MKETARVFQGKWKVSRILYNIIGFIDWVRIFSCGDCTRRNSTEHKKHRDLCPITHNVGIFATKSRKSFSSVIFKSKMVSSRFCKTKENMDIFGIGMTSKSRKSISAFVLKSWMATSCFWKTEENAQIPLPIWVNLLARVKPRNRRSMSGAIWNSSWRLSVSCWLRKMASYHTI